MKEMNIIEKLTKLGYDAPDIYWLHSFYTIELNVTSPNNDQRRIQDQRDLENAAALQKLVDGGDKFYIDQAINYGRVGLTYKNVTFKSKEGKKVYVLLKADLEISEKESEFLKGYTEDSKGWYIAKNTLGEVIPAKKKIRFGPYNGCHVWEVRGQGAYSVYAKCGNLPSVILIDNVKESLIKEDIPKLPEPYLTALEEYIKAPFL